MSKQSLASEQNSEVRKSFNEAAEKWPSSFVAREKISTFTGGAISSGHMANLDCLGEGPEGRVRIGRKVCYSVTSLIAWLIKRSVALN